MNPEKPDLKPWVSAGPSEKYEDTLVGNREGLEALRSYIDEALESGHSEIKDPGIEWMKVSVVEEDPRSDDSGLKWKDWILFSLIIVIFIAGIIQVFAWLK